MVTANNPIEPVAGGVVTFTAPSSGPSASLSAVTATIGADGTASVTGTAGAVAGTFRSLPRPRVQEPVRSR